MVPTTSRRRSFGWEENIELFSVFRIDFGHETRLAILATAMVTVTTTILSTLAGTLEEHSNTTCHKREVNELNAHVHVRPFLKRQYAMSPEKRTRGDSIVF